MEIKCQLDATDEFLLQNLLFAQHVSGTIMPIIMSSRVLYKWLLRVVFGAWFSSCRYVVELRVMCPVCGLHYPPNYFWFYDPIDMWWGVQGTKLLILLVLHSSVFILNF